jgi:fibronectin type 3 domain-containing protein
MKKILSSLVIAITISNFSLAQQNIMQGSNSMYIFLDEKAIGANFKNNNYDYAIISANNNGKWTEVAKVQGASNMASFKSSIGNELMSGIGKIAKTKTDMETWNYITNNPVVQNYSVLAFVPELLQGLGTLYIHNIDLRNQVGKKLQYQVQYFKNNSKQKETPLEIVVEEKLKTGKPKIYTKVEADSFVAVKWYLKTGPTNKVTFGNIYKADDKGNFSLLKKGIAFIPSGKKDSIVFSINEKTTPQTLHQYFVRPTNYAGLEGDASDTVSLFSVNFEQINQVSSLKIKDTIQGIYLSFTPPAPSPLITGIVIERSRFDKIGYVAIDTVPATANSYIDTKLLPNTMYYYQLRTLSIKQLKLLPSAWGAAQHINKSDALPLPPVNVQAKPTSDGVALTWEAQAMADVAGFKVFRANGKNERMDLISLIIRDNKFIDTTAMDNRRQYAYAVKSINYSEIESSFSSKIFASPVNNIITPISPVGLQAAAENGRILLKWNNMRGDDAYIKGYKIYRKELKQNEGVKTREYTSQELLKTGFKYVTTTDVNAYADEFPTKSNNYYYYVTSIDDKEVESVAANGVAVEIPKTKLLPPGNFSVRKVSTGVVISWDKNMQSGISGYIIYKRDSNTPKPVQLTRVDSKTQNFTDKVVQKNKTYYYSIAAINNETTGSTSLEKGVFID